MDNSAGITSEENTALGNGTLRNVTSGANNTAVGSGALANNTTAGSGTAVGFQAGFSNTTGAQITAVGNESLYSNTTGSNTAVGHRAGYNITTGNTNTLIGRLAGSAITTGNYNNALGNNSLQANLTGSGNTAIGEGALYDATGTQNTAVGSFDGSRNAAGRFLTTGSYNTFVGGQSGGSMTTGSKNTIIGSYTGNQGGIDIRTSDNNIVISDGDGNPRGYHVGNQWQWIAAGNGSTTITWDGSEFFPTPDNTVKLGFPSYRWTTVYATTGTINTSDVNQKQDIALLDDAEKRVAIAIKSLIKKYRFKDAVAQKGDAARIHVGAIAQDVQAAFVAESLDPTRYALFCSDTWYEVDGKAGMPSDPYTAETEGAIEVTRLGLRYEQLLAFVIAAL
jgi:hypothetical protein